MYELLPYFAIATLVIVVIILYSIYFRSRGKALSTSEVELNTPSNMKPEIIYLGQGGIGYKGELDKVKTHRNDKYAELQIVDKNIGKLLISVEKENLKNLTEGAWNNVSANGIIYACNVDASGVPHDWDETRVQVMRNRMLELEREKEKGKQETIEAIELSNQLQEALAGRVEKKEVESEF